MIVITGASDGLGKELAKLYKEAGKTVVNVSRTESEFADHNILHNLREGDEIIAAAKEIEAIDEKLEFIVNCAGVMSIEVLGDITAKEVRRLMSTNIESQILLVSNLLERIKNDNTDIINVSSTQGAVGSVGQTIYNASKWAVRGFSANLQAEFKGSPTRVISFCIGGFESRIFEKAAGYENEKSGVIMDPKDIAFFMKQILDLPKNMEVSEVIINRKAKL